MREFDREGLTLCEYQGRLFEKSADLDCSSPIFIRRFLHSDLLNTLDKNNSALLPDINDAMENISNQFGKSEYGRIKFSKSSLFWIGYIYRYISYTREQPAYLIMKLFYYKQLNDVYYSYHTQDLEWCVASLLELNGLTESIFDNNERIKMVMRRMGYGPNDVRTDIQN